MLKVKFLKYLSIILIIGLVFSCTPVFAETGDTVEEGNEEIVENEGNEDNATDEEETIEGTEEGIENEETEETTNEGLEEEETEENNTNPGITPDSIFYVFDRLLENILIGLTSDEIKKANLLMSISQERVAEAAYLIAISQTGNINEEKWNKLFQDVITDYQTKVDKSIELVEKVYDLENVSKEAMDQLIDNIITSVDFNIEMLNENKQIGEVKDRAILVANVISGLDKDLVAEIRTAGVGYGQISQIFALAEASGKEVAEVAVLFNEEGMGLGEAKKILEINASDLAKIKRDIKETPVNVNNQNKVELNFENNNEGEENQIQAINEVKANNSNINGVKENNGNTVANNNKTKNKPVNVEEELEEETEIESNNINEAANNAGNNGKSNSSNNRNSNATNNPSNNR